MHLIDKTIVKFGKFSGMMNKHASLLISYGCGRKVHAYVYSASGSVSV